MKNQFLLCLLFCALFFSGCEEATPPKIGVSFGVGDAARWPKEAQYMAEKAQALGASLEVRFSKPADKKTQEESCIELIDSGISVLILISGNDKKQIENVLAYAKQKDVKIIAYARPIFGEPIDLLVGYDTYRIGQSMALYLAEHIYKGTIAILKGDKNDINVSLMYDGGMVHFRPMLEKGELKSILDEHIPGWSADTARNMLREAILKNNGQVDAIWAQNDAFAGAAAEVLKELGIKKHVFITGMDADLAAIRRVVSGAQDMTVYMDLQIMSHIAVEQAYKLATKEQATANAKFDNDSSSNIDAYLINGKIITKENIDSSFIDTGLYTVEQVYGAPSAE